MVDDKMMQALLDIVWQAGEKILDVYETEFQVMEKSDQSPLTRADLAAHHTIVKCLHELAPGIPVLSEEAADIPFDERREWKRYWLVDPLDGTKEFVKRNGEFTVNIALIENGAPKIGVVHVPVTGVSYYGKVGEGAFRQGKGALPVAISVREAPPVLTVVGSRSHASAALESYLQRLGEHDLVSMGSSLKFCLVAEGAADIYPRLGLTSEWDTAAAQAVVEAAGGQVTDTQMKPLRYNQKESLLNPHFFVFGESQRDWSQFLENR